MINDRIRSLFEALVLLELDDELDDLEHGRRFGDLLSDLAILTHDARSDGHPMADTLACALRDEDPPDAR